MIVCRWSLLAAVGWCPLFDDRCLLFGVFSVARCLLFDVGRCVLTGGCCLVLFRCVSCWLFVVRRLMVRVCCVMVKVWCSLIVV